MQFFLPQPLPFPFPPFPKIQNFHIEESAFLSRWYFWIKKKTILLEFSIHCFFFFLPHFYPLLCFRHSSPLSSSFFFFYFFLCCVLCLYPYSTYINNMDIIIIVYNFSILNLVIVTFLIQMVFQITVRSIHFIIAIWKEREGI